MPEQGGGVKHNPEQKKDTEANDKPPTAAEFGYLVGHPLTERKGAVKFDVDILREECFFFLEASDDGCFEGG